MTRILCGFFLFFSLACQADTIYKQTDAQGNITYTDTPQKDAQTIIVPAESPPTITSSTPASSPPPTMPAAPGGSPASLAQPGATETAIPTAIMDDTRTPYTSFSLVSPVDQQTFQNQRLIPVEVSMVPALQLGDKVQLNVDGNPYGALVAGTQLTIGQLDRGSHTVSAALFSKDNVILKSTNTITIYVQFARLGPAVP